MTKFGVITRGALCALALSLVSARAAVLTYGNFTVADPDSSETKATFNPTGGALALAFRPNAGGYTLSQASFDLARNNNASTTARLRIYEGASAGSLASLTLRATVSLSITTAADAASILNFTGLNVSLTQNQTYWLVVDSTQGTVSVRSAAGNNLPSGTANITALGYRVYNEALTTFSQTVVSDYPNFQITVPEPHEYALVAGIGLCLFAMYRRKIAAA